MTRAGPIDKLEAAHWMAPDGLEDGAPATERPCYSTPVTMAFPTIRPRRLRSTPALRALVRETTLTPRQLVWPLFFSAAIDAPPPIGTMPGVSQLPVKDAAAAAREAAKRGLGGVILFGLPKTKDARGSSGLDPDGPVPRAVAEMKSAAPGARRHDRRVRRRVHRPRPLRHPAHAARRRAWRSTTTRRSRCSREMAVVHARAGADVVAPSDMMDGRVARIRRALDESALRGRRASSATP